MSGTGFLRVKSLAKRSTVTTAARHNKREIQAELGATGTIDAKRSHLNYSLAGPATAHDVGKLAKELIAGAGITKLRKNAVMGLELVFSLAPNYAINHRAYFTDCHEWAARYFGVKVLSVDVHLDEAAPHCHVILSPLLNGRMAGSALLGDKKKILDMHKQFHDAVAARYGLKQAPARLSGAAKEKIAKAVIQRLRDTGSAMLQCPTWPTVRAKIESDPAPFAEALGIELAMPAKRQKTVAEIFTSKGKGPSKESNPIGDFKRKHNKPYGSVGVSEFLCVRRECLPTVLGKRISS